MSVVVGHTAKESDDDPMRIVYNVKRFIGREFEDPCVQKIKQNSSFKILKNNEGDPEVEIQDKSKSKTYTAEHLSSKVLLKLKANAEAFLGPNSKVTKAVVSVPAYFNESQRRATIAAAQIAGLDVLQLQNEPTAAALAYNFQWPSESSEMVLVFDLGGGTFDVSILKIHGTKILVQAVGGDDYLGGEDIDLELVNYCIQQFEKTHGIKIDRSPSDEGMKKKFKRQHLRLKQLCEKKKKSLSIDTEVTLSIDGWYCGQDLRVTLTREKFEQLNASIFTRAMKVLDRTLETANLKPKDIDKVVLVGGSSRIPKVKQLLAAKFSKHCLQDKINPDESVAYGAALQAAILNGVAEQKLKGIIIQNVIPMSIGVELESGKFSVLIAKNTATPCEQEKVYKTKGSTVVIAIFEGEDMNRAASNYWLGKFEFEPTINGVAEDIKVTTKIDDEGILHVKAISMSDATRGKEIKILENRSRLFKECVKKTQKKEW